MTKEEVLQKVNDYCNEKSYTSSTLTDDFKNKFAEHFVKDNPEGDIESEEVSKLLKFSINTAFSSASAAIVLKTNEFESTKTDYEKQIEELKKKSKKKEDVVIPETLQEQIKELERYKETQTKNELLKEIKSLAKKDVRNDLHDMFESYISDYQVQQDKSAEEQAKALVSRFQNIFKDVIGSIKPLKAEPSKEEDEEILKSLPKVTLS